MQRQKPPAARRQPLETATTPLNDQLASVQRRVVAVVVAGTALVFWRGAREYFMAPKATIVLLGAVALVAIALWRVVGTGRLVLPGRIVSFTLLAFLVALLVSTVLGEWTMLALLGPYGRRSGALVYASYVVVMATVVQSHRPVDLERLARLLLVVLGVASAYGAVQHLGADPFTWPDLGLSPVFSTFGQQNFLAGFIAIAAPVALWPLLSKASSTAWRWASGVTVAVAALVAVATASFQGPVALVVGVALPLAIRFAPALAALAGRGARRAAVVGVPLALVLGAGVALSSRIAAELDQGLVERPDFWSAALGMFRDRPIVGWGMGGFDPLFRTYRPVGHAQLNGLATADAPHDVPLDMLVSGGVLLLVAYLAVVVLTGYALVQGLRRQEGERRLLLAAFGGAWLAYQTQSLVSIDVPPLALLHWLLAGAILVLCGIPALTGGWVLGAEDRTRQRTRQRSRSSGAQVATAAIVVVAVVAGWFATRPLRADVAAAGGEQARTEGNLDGAVQAFERAAELSPWEAIYRARLATTHRDLDDPRAALEAGIAAAEAAEAATRFEIATGEIATELDELDVAARWYRTAARRDPHSVDATLAAARFLGEHDEPEEAIALIERIDDDYPNDARLFALLGTLQQEDGDDEAARAAFERALELDPANVEATEGLDD